MLAELEWILNRRDGDGDIIFVDDAREFRGTRFPKRACSEADKTCVPAADIVYPEMSDVIEKICEWAPGALVDLERDMLKIRKGVGRAPSG